MSVSQLKGLAAAMTVAGILGACGGGGSDDTPAATSGQSSATSSAASGGAASSASMSSSSTSTASPATASSSSATSSLAASSSAATSSTPSVTLYRSSTSCPGITLASPDAASLTGTSTPLQTADYHRENNGKILPFQVINKLHGYRYAAAPVLPAWQFASSDPSGGVLGALECDVAPDLGWHSYARSSGTATPVTHRKVTVTGGRNAVKDNIYTVYNGQQFIAALDEAGLKPKIIRVVGHIDLRWSDNNTRFNEYISYTDQKYGGSINIPSNTTIVGINDASGAPARITGTTLLIGAELGTTTDVIAGANGDPQNDFGKWIGAGKDGDLFPTWTRNIILRNLRIDTPWDVAPEDADNAYADGITVSRAQNIYIDHLSLSDGDTPDSLGSDTRHDAAIDIVRGSDYVTLANTYIEKHHKTTLLGNGDSGRAWSDEGRLHTTLTGMWWSGTESRLPLVRFAQLHTFNNLVEGDTNPGDPNRKYGSGLDVRYQADVLSENNYYQFTNLKPKEVGGKVSSGKSALSYRAYNEWFINDKDDNSKPWSTTYNGALDITAALLADPALPFLNNWKPPYAYTAKSPDAACSWIRSNSGAGTGAGRAYMPAAATCAGLSTTSSSSAASSSSAMSSSSAAASSSGTGGSGSYPLRSGWSDEFSLATTATLFTSGYASFTKDDGSNASLYYKAGGSPTVTNGVVTLSSARFTVGELNPASATSSTSAGPLGIFSIVGKTCTLTINASQPGTGSGKFLVSVDNNTTSSGNSPHASAKLSSTGSTGSSGSTVVSTLATSIAGGDNVFTWTLSNAGYTGGSFLQIRTESGSSVYLNSIGLNCI